MDEVALPPGILLIDGGDTDLMVYGGKWFHRTAGGTYHEVLRNVQDGEEQSSTRPTVAESAENKQSALAPKLNLIRHVEHECGSAGPASDSFSICHPMARPADTTVQVD
jgi:hypothetical protein